MTWLAGTITVAVALAMIAMALLGVWAPELLRWFLRGFASSARAHYLELGLRLVAGASFVVFSSHMHFTDAFRLFGWIIVLTSAGMLLIPWHWHQRFAGQVIPVVIRYLPLYALGSLVLGGIILYGLARALDH